MAPFAWCQLRNRMECSAYRPIFYIATSFSSDIVILHLGLLLCKNGDREIKATPSLRYLIGLNVSAIFGVKYTDLRGLPSGILFGKF